MTGQLGNLHERFRYQVYSIEKEIEPIYEHKANIIKLLEKNADNEANCNSMTFMLERFEAKIADGKERIAAATKWYQAACNELIESTYKTVAEMPKGEIPG